jgi:aminopeptidase-like protein
MKLLKEFEQQDLVSLGRDLHGFAAELYPICRSITGDGMRQTLERVKERIPLQTFEVASGTPVFDWTVPKEWNIQDAYIRIPGGKRIVDFRQNNLHLLNYSTPVRATMSLAELKPHLFSMPDHPDWIPYRTSYYQPNWGFCLTHNQLLTLEDRSYEVCIDSTLEDGHLTYGECYLPGRSSDEVLISCHACHPSLANDNLSGLAVATFLANFLSGQDLRYSYRFVFIPGTIGAITWLARSRDHVGRIRHGLVLTGIGDKGGFHYKKSRRGDADIDRASAHVLKHSGEGSEVLEFSPYGYDERQYCSPGFNLAVGCLMRSVWATFPEYHTSADNLDFIHPMQLAKALRVCAGIVDVLENNRRYRNLSPHCEPQLGKRNLYRATGGESIGVEIKARLWLLNFSDGDHSLLDIADRSGLPFPAIQDAADLLMEAGLLAAVAEGESLENGIDRNAATDISASRKVASAAARSRGSTDSG